MLCHFYAFGFKAPRSFGVSLHRLSEPATFLNSNIVAHCLSLGKALIECLIRATPHSNRLQGGIWAPGALHYLMYLHKACKHLLSKQSLDEARFMILLDNKLELLLLRIHQSTFHEVFVLHWVWLLCESHLSSLIKYNISSRSNCVPHRALLFFFVWVEIKGLNRLSEVIQKIVTNIPNAVLLSIDDCRIQAAFTKRNLFRVGSFCS